MFHWNEDCIYLNGSDQKDGGNQGENILTANGRSDGLAPTNTMPPSGEGACGAHADAKQVFSPRERHH